MDSIKVLVTGAGAPGFMGTFKSLVHNYDSRKIDIVGCDAKDNVMGKYILPKFYQVPNGNEEGYIEAIRKIYDKEKIDVILPQCTNEIYPLSQSDMRVAISKVAGIANDKAVVYGMAEARKIPVPKWIKIEGNVVIKPTISNGGKGLKIIENNGKVLVSEYLEGDEYTVDCFRSTKTFNGGQDVFVAIPRLREEIRNGITWKSKVVYSQELIEYSKRLAEGLHLKYAFGFQFKGGKLLECNPRIQGTMVHSTLAGANIIYSAVKLALKEPIPEFKIDWNSKMIRYTMCKAI